MGSGENPSVLPRFFYHLPLGVLGLGHGENQPGHQFYTSGSHPLHCSHFHLVTGFLFIPQSPGYCIGATLTTNRKTLNCSPLGQNSLRLSHSDALSKHFFCSTLSHLEETPRNRAFQSSSIRKGHRYLLPPYSSHL